MEGMWEDRKKQELKEAAIAVLGARKESTVGTTILQEPRKDEGRTFLIGWKRRIDLIVIVSFLDWIHEESMGWRELEKRPRSQSFDGVFAAIAASFSSCFFLSSHIPSHPEKTYNLEPPISIYLKNTSLYLEHYLSIH